MPDTETIDDELGRWGHLTGSAELQHTIRQEIETMLRHLHLSPRSVTFSTATLPKGAGPGTVQLHIDVVAKVVREESACG